MKALVLDNYMELNYRDVPDPQLEVDEVLIRVKRAEYAEVTYTAWTEAVAEEYPIGDGT